MDNAAIARILREIADLLEIKDDNPFKIRAYRNGADIVANHPHEMAALDATGLREIPGIGKDLAARIREIVETGDAEFHRELMAEFPPTILDVLNLQGVGPKTVAMLYRELGIRTVEDLEKAAVDGKVRSLRGMGTEEGSAHPQGARRSQASRRPAPPGRCARRRLGAGRLAPRTRAGGADRSRSAACGAAAKPAAISTSWPRARRRR